MRRTAPSPGNSSYDPVLIRQALTITPERGGVKDKQGGGGEREREEEMDKEGERETDK